MKAMTSSGASPGRGEVPPPSNILEEGPPLSFFRMAGKDWDIVDPIIVFTKRTPVPYQPMRVRYSGFFCRMKPDPVRMNPAAATTMPAGTENVTRTKPAASRISPIIRIARVIPADFWISLPISVSIIQ